MRKLDGGSSTRFILRNVALKTGDRIIVEGTPEGAETAALDYVEIEEEVGSIGSYRHTPFRLTAGLRSRRKCSGLEGRAWTAKWE